jgi:hypothetical protein
VPDPRSRDVVGKSPEGVLEGVRVDVAERADTERGRGVLARGSTGGVLSVDEGMLGPGVDDK